MVMVVERERAVVAVVMATGAAAAEDARAERAAEVSAVMLVLELYLLLQTQGYSHRHTAGILSVRVLKVVRTIVPKLHVIRRNLKNVLA